MNRRLLVLGVIILSGLAFSLIRVVFSTQRAVEINVCAASSLKDVLEAIARSYRRESDVKIIFNFGSSGALRNQVEQGVPCDLLILAAQKPMDQLEREGKIRGDSRRNIIGNELVLILPASSSLGIDQFNDLTHADIRRLAVGAPESVPAGQYAMQVFNYYAIRKKLEKKFVLGTNARAVLAYVENGNVDAGVVYRTDALRNVRVRVTATAPSASHEPILYPAAIPLAAERSVEAADFMKFLEGPESRRIFGKYGFVLLKQDGK